MGRKLKNEEMEFVIQTIVDNSPYFSGIILGLGINLDLGEDTVSLRSTTETPVIITRDNLQRPNVEPRQDLKFIDQLVLGYALRDQSRESKLLFCTPTKSGIMGGIGVTARDIESTEEMLPGIQTRLAKETGKVVFLGNGLSDVPLALSERYGQGTIVTPPTIVDIFNYSLLEQELFKLKLELDTRGFGYLMQDHLNNTSALNQAQKTGKLRMVNYFFGRETTPSELSDSNLVITCMGPPMTSIKEQLSLLKTGGELYTTDFAKMIALALQLQENQTHFSLSYNSDVRQFTMRQTYQRGACGLNLPATTIIQRV